MDIFNVSSQVTDLKKKIEESYPNNLETVLECSRELIHVAEMVGDTASLAFAHYYMSVCYYNNNDMDKYFQYAVRSIDLLLETEQWLLATKGYNMLAITAINQGNPGFAINYFMSGIDCSKHCQEQDMVAGIYLNIASLYLECKVYDRAMEYIRLAEELLAVIDSDKKLMVHHVIAILLTVNCHISLKSISIAKKYFKKLDEFDYMSDDILHFSRHVMDVKLADYEDNEDAFALNVKKCKDLLKPGKTYLDIFDDIKELCDMLLKHEDYDDLLYVLDFMEEQAQKSEILNLQVQLLSLRITYYIRTGKRKEFYEATGRYYVLREHLDDSFSKNAGDMVDMRIAMQRIEDKNQTLQKKSETDALTGLPNRFRMNDYLDMVFEKSYKEKKPFGLEILDVDYFKEFNDTYGHDAGDECLRKVAEVLQKQVIKDKIFAARYGGDEFLLIYSDMDQEAVEQVAQTLEREIAQLEIPHKNSAVSDRVTVSQGVFYSTPVNDNRAWDFLHEADLALYKVKRSTRNGICFENERQDDSFSS